MSFLLMKTSEKPVYEPFPEISGSRSRLIVSQGLVWRSTDPLTCLHFVDDIIGRQEEGLVDNSTLVVQPTLGGCASTSVIVTH